MKNVLSLCGVPRAHVMLVRAGGRTGEKMTLATTKASNQPRHQLYPIGLLMPYSRHEALPSISHSITHVRSARESTESTRLWVDRSGLSALNLSSSISLAIKLHRGEQK
eukprot:scaffold10651_cov91-Cylindrotheca_fusiformis.AAC.2